MHFIIHLVMRFGYAGIFSLLMLGILGLPVPDETLLTFCGFLVSKGDLALIPTLAAAFLGSCAGVSGSYIIGRSVGLPAIRRFGRYVHLDESMLARVHAWFARYGRWTLTAGYFVPGFRHVMAIVAGTSGLEYRIFAPFAYGGALLWSASFVMLGYQVGGRWKIMSHTMHRTLLIVLAVLAAAGVLLAGIRWLAARRARRRQR